MDKKPDSKRISEIIQELGGLSYEDVQIYINLSYKFGDYYIKSADITLYYSDVENKFLIG